VTDARQPLLSSCSFQGSSPPETGPTRRRICGSAREKFGLCAQRRPCSAALSRRAACSRPASPHLAARTTRSRQMRAVLRVDWPSPLSRKAGQEPSVILNLRPMRTARASQLASCSQDHTSTERSGPQRSSRCRGAGGAVPAAAPASARSIGDCGARRPAHRPNSIPRASQSCDFNIESVKSKTRRFAFRYSSPASLQYSQSGTIERTSGNSTRTDANLPLAVHRAPCRRRASTRCRWTRRTR